MSKDRKIGVAMDFSEGSKMALNWAVDSLLDKGDTLFIIHVNPNEGNESRNLLWSSTGSPLIPLVELCDPEVLHKYGVNFGPEVLGVLETTCKQKEVTVVGKIYWGDARDKLCDAVGGLKLDCLVMGSRGLGTIQKGSAGECDQPCLSQRNLPGHRGQGSEHPPWILISGSGGSFCLLWQSLQLA